MNRRKFYQQAVGFLAVFGIVPFWARGEYRAYKKVERLETDGSITKLFDGFRSVKRGERIRWGYRWPIPDESPFVVLDTNPVPETTSDGTPCFMVEWTDESAVEYYEKQDLIEAERLYGSERISQDANSAAVAS